MKETTKHINAFERYYEMQDSRNLVALAEELSVSRPAVENWSKAFNWQERIVQRDLENRKPLEEQTNKRVVDARAEEIAKIRERRSQLKTERGYFVAVMARTKKPIEDGDLGISNMKDMSEAEKAMLGIDREDRELRKQEMALLGVAMDKVEHSGEIDLKVTLEKIIERARERKQERRGDTDARPGS